MSSTARKILVTSALPYANGPIHLGHILEQVQADIWVRFQRLQGHQVYFICGEDAHGSGVMLKAAAAGLSPEELTRQNQLEHQRDFADFSISFDNYYTTHSPENRTLVEEIYQKLKLGGWIKSKTVSQLYDPEKGLFLADRFIKGNCPRCGAADQYGDNCEACGANYSAMELVNPRSRLSDADPIVRESEHFFFDLSTFTTWILEWIRSGPLPPAVANKLQEWFEGELRPWDISRDAPYFGFEIPDAPGKYFYVWLDAPIGYMASFKNLCDQRGDLVFEDFWRSEADSELYHFIGKDIIYFHGIFWPAMLKGSGFRTPSQIFPHGYVTINGIKMSKSRGNFITARNYLEHFEADCLRYYYAAKSSPTTDDIDLNLADFAQRVNSDIVNKLVNLASRTAPFLQQRFAGQLAEELDDPELHREFIGAKEEIAKAYEKCEFGKATRRTMQLCDRANSYIDQQAPWKVAKVADQSAKLQRICSMGINLFRILMTYLKPVMPNLSDRAESFLNCDLQWHTLDQPLSNHTIRPFKQLFQRIAPERINAMLTEQPAQKTAQSRTAAPAERQPIAPTLSIDDFAKVDLRIARIQKAELVPEADKLLKLTLDIGGESRQIFAGIKSAYDPADLEGRLTVVVANLAPRKMRFGVSEGMVLAAGSGGKDLFILSPDSGAEPGMRVT